MMANPQLENGFIRIANDLYKAIYTTDMSGSELRILMFIIYQTYGYNQKSRKLTVSYIATGTNLSKISVKRSLKSLIDRKIVNANSDYLNTPKTLSINKKYNQWSGIKNDTKVVSKMTTQNRYHNGINPDTKMVSEMTPNTRQTIQDRKNKTEREGTPTKNEAILYFSERGFSEGVADDFFNYYDGLGWKVKGSKIVKWQVFADRWMKNERGESERDPDLDEFGNRIKRHVRQTL